MKPYEQNDAVEYELSESGDPRWLFDEDRGGSGKWVKATVISTIGGHTAETHETERGTIWRWPMEKHPCFDENQSKREGYLRRVEE